MLVLMFLICSAMMFNNMTKQFDFMKKAPLWGIPLDKKVWEILDKYNFPEDCYESVEKFFLALYSQGIPFIEINEKIWDKDLLLHPPLLKLRDKLLVLVNLTYLINCPIRELNRVSNQSAKSCEDLRKRGFIFKEREGSSGYYSYWLNSVECRKIIGVCEVKDPLSCYVKCSKDKLKSFLLNKRDPFIGSRNGLQLDHRTPVKACEKLGIQPAVLTDKMILNGSAEKEFQLLTKNNNRKKAEVCKKCLVGEDIFLPHAVVHKDAYKNRWDSFCEENKSCVGCWWHNCDILQCPDRV